MKDNEKFKVVNETKKFIDFINEILVNYPKKSYILRDKIEETSYEILELIYLTNLIDDRLDKQKEIISKISMLDYYLEISYDKQYISLKKLTQGARLLEVIRKLMFGWIKSNES